MKRRSDLFVLVRLAGFIDGRPVQIEGRVELEAGARLKQLFGRADKALDRAKARPFRRSLQQAVSPVILVNGERLDWPAGRERVLEPDDQVSVLLAAGGG